MKDGKVFISLNNRQELEEAIENVEGKARVRKVSVAELNKAVSKLHFWAMEGLDNGMEILLDLHAQHIPPTYQGDLKTTQFKIMWSNDSWYITRIIRSRASKYKAQLFNNPEKPNPKLDKRMKEFTP